MLVIHLNSKKISSQSKMWKNILKELNVLDCTRRQSQNSDRTRMPKSIQNAPISHWTCHISELNSGKGINTESIAPWNRELEWCMAWQRTLAHLIRNSDDACRACIIVSSCEIALHEINVQPNGYQVSLNTIWMQFMVKIIHQHQKRNCRLGGYSNNCVNLKVLIVFADRLRKIIIGKFISKLVIILVLLIFHL